MRVLTVRGKDDSKINQDSSVKRQSIVSKSFAKQDENRIFRQRPKPCGVAQALGAKYFLLYSVTAVLLYVLRTCIRSPA